MFAWPSPILQGAKLRLIEPRQDTLLTHTGIDKNKGKSELSSKPCCFLLFKAVSSNNTFLSLVQGPSPIKTLRHAVLIPNVTIAKSYLLSCKTMMNSPVPCELCHCSGISCSKENGHSQNKLLWACCQYSENWGHCHDLFLFNSNIEKLQCTTSLAGEGDFCFLYHFQCLGESMW